MTTRLIRTKGAELSLEDQGLGEPALIFLHYWGGSVRTWTPTLAVLPATIRAVAIDQRGWGNSRATDGKFSLEALADDVTDVIETLGIERYVLVGHSMGGKVAQILAGRRALGLVGMVLVAPAPPTPMPVPTDIRAGMLASYQSRDGAMEAMKVLAGPKFPEELREQVITDTLRGDAGAKESWPEQGMLADISAGLPGNPMPIEVLVGDHDQVERESALRQVFARHLPEVKFTVIPGAGHLLPLEAPQAIASACERVLGETD